MKNTITFDIETIAVPAQNRLWSKPTPDSIKYGTTTDPVKKDKKYKGVLESWESGEKAALDPLQGEIIVIGFAAGDQDPVSLDQTKNAEIQMLEMFWDLFGSTDQEFEFVGHNTRFDAGYLVVRSWKLGIKVPSHLQEDLFSYAPRFWKDTMTRFRLGDRSATDKSLKTLCDAFGIPVKTSAITGANVGEWWKKDPDAVVQYCLEDVVSTRELWKRMQ